MRFWRGSSACALVLALFGVLAVPGAALAADPIFETYKVPTVGGAEINVEVMRPADNPDAVKGYDRTPDYDAFWLERDYRKDAANIRVPVLVAHGWQDYNVKQEEGVELYRALTGTPFKRLFMFQGGHARPSAPSWQPLLDRFFDHTLMGVANGVDTEAPVLTEGRTASQASTGFRTESDWPPPGTRTKRLMLTAGGEQVSFADLATATEEQSTRMPAAESQWIFFKGDPFTNNTRMTGSARLRLSLEVDREHAHLTPLLVDVAPDGTTKTVSRGFLNLRYLGGLSTAQPIPVNEPIGATVTFKPQDQTFEAGHRVGVILQGSNTVWAVPDDPGATYTISSVLLELPLS